MFKVGPLLSTTPAEMYLIAVLMRDRVIWFEYRPIMFPILVLYFSRSVLDVLHRTFVKLLLVELRYHVG